MGLRVFFYRYWKNNWHIWTLKNKIDKISALISFAFLNKNIDNCYLHSENKLLVALGIKDLIVVNTDDATLVAHKNQSENIKQILTPIFQKHMDDIMSGHFSKTIMEDWANDDANLLSWRAATGETAFEKTTATSDYISEQEYFDHGILMVAFVRSGVELAFETMVASGIVEASAYYESLHELPLIANTIARKKLFEMNRII